MKNGKIKKQTNKNNSNNKRKMKTTKNNNTYIDFQNKILGI